MTIGETEYLLYVNKRINFFQNMGIYQNTA